MMQCAYLMAQDRMMVIVAGARLALIHQWRVTRIACGLDCLQARKLPKSFQ